MIFNGDCISIMRGFKEESYDAIITDPPYGINKEKIEGDEDLTIFFKSISEFKRLLKPGAFCATFSSIKHLPDIIEQFKLCGFLYEWMYICYINNGMVRGRMGFSCYMPILIFSRMGEGVKSKIHSQLRDVCELSASAEKLNSRIHPYQKDTRFISPLIKAITPEGGKILDPFCGSGSIVLSAIQNGFNADGIEIDTEYFNLASKRINGYTRIDLFNY